MSRESKRILVAGGGIGGLSVAWMLSRLGHEVTVLEQAPDFTEVGAGIQLAPNGVRALRTMGLESQVEAVIWQPDALRMRNGYDGSAIVSLPTGSAFAERYGANYYVIHRADLLDILLRACHDEPRVTLTTGARVTAITEDENGVAVTLANGRMIEGDALVGADGLRSVVRQTIVGDGAPALPRHVVYRGVIARDDLPEELWSPSVTMWVGANADFVHYPLRGGALFNLVVTFRSPVELDPENTSGSFEDMAAPFEGFADEVHQLLKLLPHDRRWLVCDRAPAAGWSRGSLTLLGDAAHPMLQYLAQGACQALEDSEQLYAELAAESHIPTAFDSYWKKRYLRTARVQLTARQFIEICQAGSVLADVRARFYQGRSTEQLYDGLDWLYSPKPELRFA
ncbi:MAG: FAD-dependent oxidoreductase [Rhizobiaceae bacterium]